MRHTLTVTGFHRFVKRGFCQTFRRGTLHLRRTLSNVGVFRTGGPAGNTALLCVPFVSRLLRLFLVERLVSSHLLSGKNSSQMHLPPFIPSENTTEFQPLKTSLSLSRHLFPLWRRNPRSALPACDWRSETMSRYRSTTRPQPQDLPTEQTTGPRMSSERLALST